MDNLFSFIYLFLLEPLLSVLMGKVECKGLLWTYIHGASVEKENVITSLHSVAHDLMNIH